MSWDAKLEYKETREEEDINLSVLVKDRHIACREWSWDCGLVLD